MTDRFEYCTAYELVIQSEFDLPELPTVDDHCQVDVVIQRGDLAPVSFADSGGKRQTIQKESDACRITHQSIGTFLIEDGNTVICDPVSPDITTKKIFRRFLESQVMAMLLLQRDLLILHASAVSVDERGIIFLGPRGAGKSTTASAFYQTGYALLEDDIVALKFVDGTPIVLPGIPQLRLSTDTVDSLDVQNTSKPALDWGEKKHYHEVDSHLSPCPLAGCYFLEEGDELSISELSGSDRFFRLLEHVYPQGLLSDDHMTDSDFERCSMVLESVPIRTIHRPKEFGILPSIVEMVVDDINLKTK